MKRLLCLSAGIVAMSVFSATAEQAAPPPLPGAEGTNAVKMIEPPPRPQMKEITITGTISQKEMKNKKGETLVVFVMKSDDGATVRLPRPPAKADNSAFKLEDYVGGTVKVTGMGFEREHNGKKMIGLQKITSIDKVATAAPVAAPAAVPAAAPAK